VEALRFSWLAPSWRRGSDAGRGDLDLPFGFAVAKVQIETMLRLANDEADRQAERRPRVNHAYAGIPLATIARPATDAIGFSRHALITNAAQNTA
jgi:hypothetical protein